MVEGGLLGVVGQHHDARQAADQRQRRVNLVAGRAVLGAFVGRVQMQDGAGHHVHQVGRRVAHENVGGEAVGQLALGIDHLHEAGQTLAGGQLAHEQQVGHLLVGEAALGIQIAQQIIDIVAAQAQASLGRHLLAVGHYITVHVGHVGHARQHAGPIGVAQTALHVVGLIMLGVDGVHLVEVLVQAHATRLILADLDGLGAVDIGAVVHADNSFVDFHGHGALLSQRGRRCGRSVSVYCTVRARRTRAQLQPPPRSHGERWPFKKVRKSR